MSRARALLRPARRRIEILLLVGIGRLMRSLPLEKASDAGAVLGRVAHRLLRRRRRIALDNVVRSLGAHASGEPAERLVARAFEQLGRSFAEFLALPAHPRDALLERIEFVGFDAMVERARRREGLVAVTGHFGNWELLGASFGWLGGSMTYVLPAQSNAASDRYLNRLRASLGVRPIPIGHGMRDALRALRRGECLAMLPDQDARDVGVHVPFLGRPASTHTGPARLALRAGAPIMVALIERVGSARFRATVERVLWPRSGADVEEEVLRLTREMTEAIEAGVRRRPDHWYWIHRRWKTPAPVRRS